MTGGNITMEEKIEIKNKNIRLFLEKLGQNPELQEKLSQIRDPEEAYKLASGVQEGFTKEEFVTEMKRLYEELCQDLSEEDVAKIAGGGVDTQMTKYVTSILGSATASMTGIGVSVAITGSSAAAAL